MYVARGTRVALAFYRRDDRLHGLPAGSLESRLAPLHGLFAREQIESVLVISYRGATPGRGLRDFDARVALLRDPDEPGPPPGSPADVAGELIETFDRYARYARPHGGLVAAWTTHGAVQATDRAEIAYAHAAMLEIAAARALE